MRVWPAACGCFINKGWGYGDANPDHDFLALNYRMSELQGAVAAAPAAEAGACSGKACHGSRRSSPPEVTGVRRNRDAVRVPRDSSLLLEILSAGGWECHTRGRCRLGRALRARQISCAPRYMQKPAFMCRVFQEQKTFGNSRFPFTLARPEVLQYDPRLFPLTMKALNEVLVLPWNENYLEEHLDYIADSIHESIFELL